MGRCLFLAISLPVLLMIPAYSQTAEQQSLRDQYQDRIFMLRGFYSGDRLQYRSSSSPPVGVTPGDWTANGFVLVTDIQFSNHRLSIKAKRLLVVSIGHGFQFYAETAKKRQKAPSLEIEMELASADPDERAGDAMSKIFLTAEDSLVDLVADDWEPCVRAGVRNFEDDKFRSCHFSQEMLAVPGVMPRAISQTKPEADFVPGDTLGIHVFHVGKSISPPRTVFSPEPEFSAASRVVNLHGMVTLMMIVDNSGVPRDVHIVSPLGCGLDAQAVRTVQTWRFKPAEQEGHEPVAVEIAVETDFHRY
jgi:TonB family protein